MIDGLLKTLGEYNPTTNEIMGKIAIAMQPLALAIIGVLFLIELESYSRKFAGESGGLSYEVLSELALKYIIATFLILCSGLIIDSIVWFGVEMSKWIESIVKGNTEFADVPSMEKAAWWQKAIVFLFQVLAYIFQWLTNVIGGVIGFLRMLQLYIVKAIAPILVAFFVHNELRSISINFFKHVMAIVLQGALLILIWGLIPILMTDDIFPAGTDGDKIVVNIMLFVVFIFKSVVAIVLLIGSQGMAKKFMGAM